MLVTGDNWVVEADRVTVYCPDCVKWQIDYTSYTLMELCMDVGYSTKGTELMWRLIEAEEKKHVAEVHGKVLASA